LEHKVELVKLAEIALQDYRARVQAMLVELVEFYKLMPKKAKNGPS
jgi:hypothetical protein